MSAFALLRVAATGRALRVVATRRVRSGRVVGYSWQRQDGDQWTDVPSTKAFPALALLLRPGQSYRGSASPEEVDVVPQHID